MRIAIVSDTHGHLDPRVLRAISGCALAVHAGDVGDGGVLDLLETCCAAVVAVRGNNDTPERWASGQLERLAALPESAAIEVPGGMIRVVHGDRAGPVRARHARLRDLYADARVVIYGHSHRLCVDRSSRPWVVNPGAAGRARTFGGPSCLLLDARDAVWRVRSRRFEPNPTRRR